MTYTILAYCLYILITLVVIVRAGQALYQSGYYFLVKTFEDEGIATAINKLLLLGYYLLNLAYVLLVLQEDTGVANSKALLDMVGQKAGMIILLLAGMHYFNLIVFVLWKKYGGVRSEK